MNCPSKVSTSGLPHGRAVGRVFLTGLVSLLSACGPEQEGAAVDLRSQELVVQLPARIEAEAFERYYDTDTNNQGNCGSGAVDREQTLDPGGGCNVGWTAPGEWLEYDVSVAQASSFDVVLRVASAQAGRTLRVEVDGVNVSGSIVAPSAGWQTFENRTVQQVPLTAGNHTIRVVFETGSLNLNYIDVVANPPAASGALIDAHFNSGMEGFSYSDDAFRGTSAPTYAAGTHQNGNLVVTLGGQNNNTVVGMSGGFSRTFTLSQASTVSLELGYTIAQSCTYETDEQSEMLLAIDGVLVGRYGDAVDRVTGDGNACPGSSSSGLFFHTAQLLAGTHTLTIGGYNNKKTASDEVTTALIDRVLLTTDTQCASASPAYAQLCSSCGGTVECGECSSALPQNLGAPCGSCGGVVQCDGTCSEPLTSCNSAPTATERLAACALDPRVVTGLVTAEVCAGAEVFFRETFEGNGRTCGSCHPVANNYTIDPDFVGVLHDVDPLNPLFVNEWNPALAQLETSDLLTHAAILENIDGFQDPANRYVSRSVPHLFSLSQTISVDPSDTTSSPPVARTGWGGDGAPGDGSLNAFLEGAIVQHFPQSLQRQPGVDFRLPTAVESDLVEEFQLSLGRQAELDLASVQLINATAEMGRQAYMDPLRATCGVCHSNGGSNFSETGFNRNLDNGIRSPNLTLGSVNGQAMSDAGFGGADLASPNADPIGLGTPSGFGNVTFSPPSLIEAADTPPFFHSNAVFNSRNGPTLDDVTQFYGDGNFQNSSGKAELDALFGPAEMSRVDLGAVVRMLHVLNAAFNIDLAVQRLDAVRTMAQDLGELRGDVQIELLNLAGEELEDAIFVLSQVSLHPEIVTDLTSVLNAVRAPSSQNSATVRVNAAASAIATLVSTRSGLGSNIDFVLGTGTLMY